MCPPEPRRGGLIIAQGKAAEAAALGKGHPTPISFFGSDLARLERAKSDPKKGKGSFWSPTQAGARFSLALGSYLMVLTGL